MGKQGTLARWLLMCAGLGLATSLIGCSPAALAPLAPELSVDSSEENSTIQPAEIRNAGLAAEVDTLLTHFWEGEWDVPAGGNIRMACGEEGDPESHVFFGSWLSPQAASLPGDGEQAATAVNELTAWLISEGWGDLEEFEFTAESMDVNAFGVGASKRDTGVTMMQAIYYYEGDFERAYPHVVIDIDSNCLADD